MLLYFSIAVLIIVVSAFFIKKRLSVEMQKKIDENFFVILSGFSAIVIISFVIYLLIHILLIGHSQISWEFIFAKPAEGLTEGGIFPAIVGTALLVIIMSIVGVPIGTITAIYLTEYARENSVIARIIRFAVNTLAGVPAIVFGLFGLGFFIGFIGKQMDSIEQSRQMQKMEIVFNMESSPFAGDGKATPDEIKEALIKNDKVYWDRQIELTKILTEMYGEDSQIERKNVTKFYISRNRPHWAQPSLLWAALTMALLTLPVVIVSVEEAMKTVPRELREASLALGATKLETILRVVLPGSITGILTGAILAVSRGAGEVAPILFTGAAYYLPDLPNSLSSQFMELGYHIYVLTTQSTNVELTKPLQYATTLVLLFLTFALNFSAIILRSKLRSRMSR
ncbi:MAG: PstA family ABC transporter permease [Candidatus Kapabacteria bacterium]|jgi:ABC-type phosphate transport system permease subunit|nr:PstA family ABC transporter permease [Candidatus Kapabacteria bacterium]